MAWLFYVHGYQVDRYGRVYGKGGIGLDFEYWVVLIFALGILFFVVRDVHTYLSKVSSKKVFLMNKAFFSGIVVFMIVSLNLSKPGVAGMDNAHPADWFIFFNLLTFLCLIGYLITLRPPKYD